jgi:uncharacterized protein YdeI (YjbR/CyaY-like superfamily)
VAASDRPPDPPSPNGKEVFAPRRRADWRRWLEGRPDRTEGVWVVYPKRSSPVEGPTYDDLVEEALCFGWIDAVTRRADDDRMLQWFAPRRRGGVWAASNKERVERLTAEGLMTDRGQEVIDAAKADGSWSQYADAEAMVVHPDLDQSLASAPGAREAYDALAPSHKKQYLWWVYEAKRPETRAKRITEIVRRLVEGE